MQLEAAVGPTVTAGGLGGDEALRRFVDVLAPSCISTDHPRYLSFVPGAPTEASILFDLVVGASNIYGGSWLGASGALYAANEETQPVDENSNLGDSLVGELDFTRIGLMGHSRGGDGVTNFIDYNRIRPEPLRRYPIRAVIALEPTDYERLTLQTSQGYNRNWGELVIVARPTR